ncbi:amphoterin-induced protein 3 [Hypomesus transpacificus]|uniref:amphoterin-induced protein 3 n=1 Tax=Hypomesus transpacificus TaxID=137520 RepID=UPI001F087035|nr:amphoterin-induced protein 3 [Hypomesus transpacificus]XP_046897050.1 amphoterin-induced protein 3 [Hypomesus transpacificus]
MTQGLGPDSAVVLLCLLLLGCSEGTCPSICLCTADSVSCGSSSLTKLPILLPPTTSTLDLSYNRLAWLGSGSFSSLPRLDTLRLAHNQLTTLGSDVFHNASSLRHLDLSSNKLHVVEQHYFQGLWRLEELLLYNNRIIRVESGMLRGLGNLKKAYFSLNQITDFPFFSIQDHSHPFLTMLDLSSNRMTALPWEDVKALPGSVQKGLYLQNNSLACDCSMYGVFWHWEQRGFDSVKDFMDDLTCLIYGDPRAAIRFLKHSHFFQNCTLGRAVSLPVTVLISSLVVYEGERVRLDCQTSVKGKELSFTWLSPNQEYITLSTNNSLISLFPNGTLEIPAAKMNDSGMYVCTALDYKHMLNATREVNVTIVRATVDSFSTGYTTLLGCVVTLVLILMYLYLTPCRCGCCKQPLPPGMPVSTHDPSTLSSIFSPSLGQRDVAKSQSTRHVVFVESVLEEQNGCLRAALATDQPSLHWEWDTTGLN